MFLNKFYLALVTKLDSFHHFLAATRFGPACLRPIFKQKGPCTGQPSLHVLDVGRLWSCALPEKDPCRQGNHIQYYIFGPPNALVMDLQSVYGDYCEARPEACRCKNLLGNVLARYPDVNQIRGRFDANPFIKGCNCYLRSAARAGFTAVSLISHRAECTAVRSFNVDNYGNICQEYDDLNCDSGTGAIFKG